jgi:DNA-binding winged helix-turn-helix (wHTH) protein
MEDIRVPNAWLQRIGFKSGNPFFTREASREAEPELLQYFVQHPGFDDIMGDALRPESAFLVAERGFGKTTNRRAIEWNCYAGRPNGLILPIPYLEFTIPLEYADEDGKVATDHHIGVIMKEAMPLLLERVARNPKSIEEFSLGFRKNFAEYLSQYTDLNTDAGLDKWLHRIGYYSKGVNSEVLKPKKYSRGTPFLRFLVELLSLARQHQKKRSLSPIDQLSQFEVLAQLTGFKAVYILVDRVDEREPMSSNPQYAANMLGPLITNLHLMELEKTAFKFFLTPSIMNAILKKPGFRADRLMIRHISWSEAELQRLLDRRVEVFSQGMLPSLDVICDLDLVGLVAQLSFAARGSPRNILRLAEWVLYWYHARNLQEGGFLISKEDLQKSIQSFMNETHTNQESREMNSGIWIDEGAYIWRDTTRLGRLPPLQQDLLVHLLAQKGKICSYSSLRHVIYGEQINPGERIVSDDRIDQLIKRIRKLIEVDTSNPKHIIKISGKGYVLD